MSKHINVNPGQYKEAGRERQGDGIIHGNERDTFERTRAEVPHIPNQERASRPAAPGLDEEPGAAEDPATAASARDATADDEVAPPLRDDEGMPD